MTKFGTRMVDHAAALNVVRRNVGRVVDIDDQGTFIGFTNRELNRRDVACLIDGQQIQEACTEGQPFWFQLRIWFKIDVTD